MSSPKERGTLLTVWLVFLLVVYIFALLLDLALVFSSLGHELLFLFGGAVWTVYLFSALGALNIVCVCFLFFWKKWAFFLLCASVAAVLSVNLYIGAGPISVSGLGEVVITYLVLRTKWDLFDNS